MDWLVVLFGCFRVKNVKVKSSKFRIGKRVKFGGFIAGVSENGVYLEPDPDKIKSLADVQILDSKTEFRAFLGLIRQFKSWSPNLSFLSKHM